MPEVYRTTRTTPPRRRRTGRSAVRTGRSSSASTRTHRLSGQSGCRRRPPRTRTSLRGYRGRGDVSLHSPPGSDVREKLRPYELRIRRRDRLRDLIDRHPIYPHSFTPLRDSVGLPVGSRLPPVRSRAGMPVDANHSLRRMVASRRRDREAGLEQAMAANRKAERGPAENEAIAAV